MVKTKNKNYYISANNFPLVSIIIPVYNASRYLKKCIDSCINQTYSKLQIICIDDCSSDDSYEILNEYAKKDKRILVLKNPLHQSSGNSRNTGIKHAQGEYILFVDADDECCLTLVEKCVNSVLKNNSDLCLFRYDTIHENPYKCNIAKYSVNINNTDKKVISSNDYDDIFNISSPGPVKFFNIELIQSNNLEFFENIHVCEDIYFTIQAFYYAKRISYIDDVLYHYLQHEASEEHNKHEHFEDVLIVLNALKKDLFKKIKKEKLQKNFIEFIYEQLNYSLSGIKNFKSEYLKLLNTKYSNLLNNEGFSELQYDSRFLKLKYDKNIFFSLSTNIPLVSIIIPVYNGEKYIRECIDSCINQTYKNIEIICIDDASTDNTLQILKEYQKTHSNIKIFCRSKNSGTCTVTKYLGIQNAHGKFIQLLDSDDKLDVNTIETCVLQCIKSNADVCIMNICKIYETYTDYQHGTLNYNYLNTDTINVSYKDFKNILLFNTPTSCANFMRTDYLKKQIFSDKYLRTFWLSQCFAEDTYLTPHLYLLTERLTYVKNSLYNYRMNSSQSSITSISKRAKNFETMLYIISELQKDELFQKCNFTKELNSYFLDQIYGNFLYDDTVELNVENEFIIRSKKCLNLTYDSFDPSIIIKYQYNKNFYKYLCKMTE